YCTHILPVSSHFYILQSEIKSEASELIIIFFIKYYKHKIFIFSRNILIKLIFQVTGITFNKHYKEMMTSHGIPQPGVRVWRYDHSGTSPPHFDHLADLNGHGGGRVISLCESPCSEYVLSCGNDETMRLWHCWKVDGSSSSSSASHK